MIFLEPLREWPFWRRTRTGVYSWYYKVSFGRVEDCKGIVNDEVFKTVFILVEVGTGCFSRKEGLKW